MKKERQEADFLVADWEKWADCPRKVKGRLPKAGKKKKMKSCVRLLKAGWEKKKGLAARDPAKKAKGRLPTAGWRKKKSVRPTVRCASDRWLPGRLQSARLLCRGPPAQPAEEEKEEEKVVDRRSGPTAQQSAQISGATPSECADAPPRRRRQSSCREIRPDCSTVGPDLGGYTQRVRSRAPANKKME